MPNLLDVDPSILERNLLLKDIVEGDEEISADSLFNIKPKEPDDIPWKYVKLNPGYCVKLKTHEGDKVFVNVCHTDSIPEPEEVSEEKLLEMIMEESAPMFRIPISIGDLHIESDKSRNPCSVYDIAVNSNFFKKMDSSEVFNTFFLNVSIQALQDKYSLDLDLKSEKPFLLLKNRKVLGKLQVQRIQQREVKKAPRQLIQEISSKPPVKKSLIEVVSENDTQEQDKVPAKSQTHQSKPSSQQKPNRMITNVLETTQKSSEDVASIKDFQSSSTKGNPTITLNKDNQVPLSSDESEKGIKESRLTKDNVIQESDGARHNIKRDHTDRVETSELEQPHREVGQGDGQESCCGLFCLKQYPEKGFPQLLIASLRLNVKSSKDFDLELDTNRVSITVNGNEKPWFDVYLPYNIDVNKVEACFVTESQKLLIKMDVINS